MFTCKIPSHLIFSGFYHHLIIFLQGEYPPIDMYAKYKREWTPRVDPPIVPKNIPGHCSFLLYIIKVTVHGWCQRLYMCLCHSNGFLLNRWFGPMLSQAVANLHCALKWMSRSSLHWPLKELLLVTTILWLWNGVLSQCPCHSTLPTCI